MLRKGQHQLTLEMGECRQERAQRGICAQLQDHSCIMIIDIILNEI